LQAIDTNFGRYSGTVSYDHWLPNRLEVLSKAPRSRLARRACRHSASAGMDGVERPAQISRRNQRDVAVGRSDRDSDDSQRQRAQPQYSNWQSARSVIRSAVNCPQRQRFHAHRRPPRPEREERIAGHLAWHFRRRRQLDGQPEHQGRCQCTGFHWTRWLVQSGGGHSGLQLRSQR